MVRSLLRPLLATALLLSSLFGAAPAWAAVTITFWSHELGNSFPHAFFTLRGVPDAGGAPVDANYGFTAKSVGVYPVGSPYNVRWMRRGRPVIRAEKKYFLPR